MPQILTDIDVEEVSLVDDPANPGARALFFKSKKQKNGVIKMFKDVFASIKKGAQSFDDAKQKQEFLNMVWAFNDSVSSIAQDEKLSIDEKLNMFNESLNQFADELKSATNQEDTMADDLNKEKMDKEDKKAKEKAMEDAKKAEAEDAEAKKARDAELAKSKDEIAKANEQIAKANEEIAKLKAEIEKGNIEKANAERLTKAKTMVEGLSNVVAEDVAEMLKSLSPEQADKLAKTLKAAAGQANLNEVLKENGTSEGGDNNDPMSIAKARASELMQKNKNLTEAQAVAEVFKSDPKLYDQHNSKA